MIRRRFLRLATLALGQRLLWPRMSRAETTDWDRGDVRHILPTASHREFLIKVSFDRALARAPRLLVDGAAVAGTRSDTDGEFWQFRVGGLAPGRNYRLTLVEADETGGGALCEPWGLATMPAPDSRPERVSVLFFTCAGGDERSGFLPVALRARLLRRALSFGPDLAVANGDHVYRDLRPQRHRGPADLPGTVAERSLPVLGTESEAFVKDTGNRQIASVYGVDFRSTPTFFVQDDHDYYDNDEATDELVTFPPDPFMVAMARCTQRLYYPEFLPDPHRPEGLPGSRNDDDGRRSSESFGTIRYGRLLEALLYSVRRTMTMAGDDAVFVADEIESWLVDRMRAADIDHVVNVPSNPPGWSAGKWGEWYPDRLASDGRLSLARPKRFWQRGWVRQHDRLLGAMSAMTGRIPLVVSGDLHASALGRIGRTGDRDLAANPVTAVLCGTIGTGERGWPSHSRGVPPLPSLHVAMEELLTPVEQHGFTIAEFSRNAVVLKMFAWDRKTQSPADIDRLEPVHTEVIDRPTSAE